MHKGKCGAIIFLEKAWVEILLSKKILISQEVQNEKFSGKMFPLQASNSSLSDLLILSWKKEILELVNLYLD